MKKLSFMLVGAAALALTACGGQEDTAAENVQENLEVQSENLEAAADNTANTVEAAALENQAEVSETQGQKVEVAVDEADTNAANVNAM